jgi:hypothetical protein
MIIETEMGFPTARGRAQLGRETVDFEDPDHCRKCGKREGDHAIEGLNPFACVFEPIGDGEKKNE